MNALLLDELGESQYRMMPATSRAALRGFSSVFQHAPEFERDWIDRFRLAHARLILTALVHIIFEDEETEAALNSSAVTEIIFDDAIHGLPIVRWQSEIIFSFAQGVLLEQDISSIALILDISDRHDLSPDLLNYDLSSPLLKQSQITQSKFTALECSPFKEIGEKSSTLASEWDLEPQNGLNRGIFSFWKDWIHLFANGQPFDWSLQKEVALISDAIWDAGPEAIAFEIERIQAKFSNAMERPNSVPELEQTKLTKHVKQLLASPEMTALSAEGAAETLERAIKEYMNQAPANCLPDELAHLDALPSLFRSIARTVKSNDLGEAKETRLLEQIIALNAKVAQLEADLKAAKEKTLNGRFKIKAIESLGTTIGSPWFLGAMALATSHFFGLSPSELTFENLRNYTSDVLGAEPMSVDTNEQYRDVIDL